MYPDYLTFGIFPGESARQQRAKMGVYGQIKKARALCSGLCRSGYSFYSFQFRDDLFTQPLSDCAAVETDKIVYADLDQSLASDQVQAGYLAVFIVKAAAVDQGLNSSGVQIRERDDSAAGLIRPPVLQWSR